MRLRPRLMFAPLALLGLLACPAPTPEPVAPDQVAIDIPADAPALGLSAEDIHASIAFLADDAQGGRPPGSEADARVQAWVIERMRAAGLEPGAGGEDYLQRFTVGDGVRLRAGEDSILASKIGEVPHALLPFGHATGPEGLAAKAVFVGDGLALEGLKLEGKIVVALAGSADPHAPPAETRPQAKLIAARDRGAVGFVLWDPNSDSAWPNHGRYAELEIPALYVGQAGSAALREQFNPKARDDASWTPKRGAASKTKLAMHAPIEAVTLPTANVMGLLPGSAPADARRQIIVGAHFDHLGMGTASSLEPGAHAVHNGADDNASGVALVLELAELFASMDPAARPHDLLFVAFGAEELGLLGSQHMVEALDAEAKARVLAMLNFDMVGRLAEAEQLAVNGQGSASEWPSLLEAANAGLAAPLSLGGNPDGWGPSDHASFYGEGVPVLHFFTGAHADYHKPSDDLDKIDAPGAARVGELAAGVLVALLARDAGLSYVKVERPVQGRAAFRVSLGTMPDYAASVDGLALSGVREGGPAAKAGLQKGDVIVRIGAREIHNIDDYMACFAELEPGEAVEIEFERAGERMSGELVPAAPREH